ncbi:glycosyl hydrolase family 61-domain-containing protein [Xylariaceae sp. AK1471]|nr:glycosyl hydrolase family 61-domain-containing protein [Xylariaceae sp. AK1471]
MRIAHNGEWQEPLRYIRNKTTPYYDIGRPEDTGEATFYRSYNFPTYSVDRAESQRCGRDSMNYANGTDVLKVRAGDTIEFAHHRFEPEEWKDSDFVDCPDGRGTCRHDGYPMEINHQGPVFALLSKVPEGLDVHDYDGSGEWVKIYTVGITRREVPKDPKYPFLWLPQNDGQLPPRFEFKIPPQTPSGQYLLRMDLVWPGMIDSYVNFTVIAQMYPTCAQIQVESDAKSNALPKGIRIPEDFTHESPGMRWTWEMNNGLVVDDDWVYPGGPLWNGEQLVVDKPML